MIPVTAVPGDDPETFRQAVGALLAACPDLELEQPVAAPVASMRRTRVGLVGQRVWTGHGQSPAVALRESLGIFAQVRPVRLVPGLPSRYPELDLLVVRETTEDVYARLEHETVPGVFESLKITTRTACERIARHAFELARRTGRGRVTIVHKSNILKLSDGLFLRVAQEVAAGYPDIATDEVIVDALCMKLVIDPSRFRVLLCGNLYGDIVGDLCTGLAGGASSAAAIECALDGTTVFTSGHTACDPADPLPLLLAGVELLHHVERDPEADRLRAAIEGALTAGNRPDRSFCAAVEQRLRSGR